MAGASAALAGCGRTPDSEPAVPLAEKPGRIAGFDGRLVERGDPAYDRWREGMVWQMRKPDRFPDLILRPEGDADVQAAVRFAAQNGMRVAIRSGGHNIWAASLRDGGVLLDLSNFRQFSTVGGAGTARFGPSLWARDVLEALRDQGTSFPVAHCATVPLGGFAMGGGLGLNGDEWDAMACNGILGGTFVTADGEIAPVSEKENPDLLWAMRGGGGALPGVVTELEVKTFARPAAVFSATYVYPLAAIDAALELLEGITGMRPRHTEMLALMTHNPQVGADAPPDVRKVIAVRAQVYADDESAAAPVLDGIAAIPAAAQAAFSLPRMQESYEKLFVESMDWRRGFGFGRFAVENAWTNDIESAVRGISREFMQTPSWKSHVVIQPKIAPAVADGGAFSVAGNTYIGVYSVWDDEEEDDANVAWLRRMSAQLDTFGVGHYINEIDAAADTGRIRKCYSDDAWLKLRSVRERWDPDQVFHDFPGLS